LVRHNVIFYHNLGVIPTSFTI